MFSKLLLKLQSESLKCTHFYLLLSYFFKGGLRSDCLTGGSNSQQSVEPRPGAGGQTTLSAAGSTGVCLPEVPGAFQPG